LDGDYPDIKGEQMLWWIFNDNTAAHTQSGGLPLKIEIHASAYACNQTGLENTTFLNYKLNNFSSTIYDSAVITFWNDMDLGYAYDDFIGFVLGYQDGELTNANSEFLLIDWKQRTQTINTSVVGDAGLAISLVTGAGTFNEYWAHTGPVDEIKRAANLGSTGWVENQSYLFDITFTSSLVQVFVNNVLEISLTAAEAGLTSFSDGAAGFYNNSQNNVSYTGITEEVVQPPVNANAPALFGLMMFAMGVLFARRKG
jgi:hypothetical protein